MRPHTLIAVLAAVLAVAMATWAAPAPAQTAPATTTATAPAKSAPAKTTPAKTTPVDPETLPIPEGSSGPVSVGGSLGGTALRLLLGVAVVVALILGIWQLMKRMQHGRYPAMAESADGVISVVATTALGPNRTLHIVRVADEVVLIGATDQSVQSLAHLDAETARTITAALGDTPGGPGTGPGAGDRARAIRTSGRPESFLDRLRALTLRG